MSNNLELDWKGVTVIGLGIVILVWWGRKQIKDFAKAVNPIDDKNVINQGFEAVYKNLTGRENNLGEDIYDWFHPNWREGTETKKK